MKIDPLDQYHQEVFSVLKKLKHKSDLSRSNKVNYSIRLLPPTKEGEISSIDLQTILKNFVEDNIIAILDEYPVYVGDEHRPKAAFMGFDIELKEPDFNKYYGAYRKTFELPRKTKVVIYKNGRVLLFANGKQHSNKFGTSSNGFQGLMFLAKNKDVLMSYSEIGKEFKKRIRSNEDIERSARDAIQYLKSKLKYNKKDFIQTDYGFRLVCDVEIKS